MPRIFYRLVRTNPPTADDFKSHQELGIRFRRPLDTEALRISFGVSVSDDPVKLVRKIATFPELGSFLATVRIDEVGPVRWEKTTKRGDHYTLWGTAGEILFCVERIEPV